MPTRLVLHWHLDELLHQDGILDASDNHLNGTVEGAPQSLPDVRFGSALQLDGRADALTLPSNPLLALAAYTVEAWVNPVAGRREVAQLVGAGSHAFALALGADGSVQHRSGAGAGGVTVGSPLGVVHDGQWQHLAATADDSTLRLYVDGTLVGQAPRPAGTVTPGADTLVVGRSVDGPTGRYGGLLAHVRVYSGALSDVEVRLDQAEDEAELAAFVRTHPIEFELANADQHHVLYIDDAPTGQAMTLTLTNSSRQEITLAPTGPVSPASHHLALAFRAQTLAAVPAPTVTTPGWALLRSADGDTLYLSAAAGLKLTPGASTRIALTGLNADGRGGTRGTRVQLSYQQLAFTGEAEQLTGTRLQFLDVVNHRGRTDLPVQVALVGGDRVLSDGVTPSQLRLRVSNLSADAALALRGTSTSPDAATAFVVGFELEGTGQSRDTALVKSGAVQSVGLAVTAASAPGDPAATWGSPVRDLVGQRARWRLSPTPDTVLAPGGWFELTLSGVIAPPSIGQAAVRVDVLNLPGYADGAVTVAVQKSPLLFTSTPDGSVQRVGVGTVAPAARLHLFDLPADANSGSLILGPTTGSNLRLGFHGDYSWIQSHGAKPLALNPIGNNVGIGTTTPGNPLTVKAESQHLQLRREVTTSGGNQLFLELYQAQTGTQVYPSLRFHKSMDFWHRIEARPEGLLIKTGDLAQDAMADLYAHAAFVDELTFGGLLFRTHEAEILNQLTSGELAVDLFDFANNRSLGRVTLRLVNP